MLPDGQFNQYEQLSKEAANRCIADSSRSWLLYRLIACCDYQIGLFVQTRESFETEADIYETTLFLTEEFQLLAKPVDLRGNVVRQVSDSLKAWAARLNEMARHVDTIAHEPYEHKPKAYISRDAGTDELIGVRMWLAQASELSTSYEEICNANVMISVDKVENWPEVNKLSQHLCQIANG